MAGREVGQRDKQWERRRVRVGAGRRLDYDWNRVDVDGAEPGRTVVSRRKPGYCRIVHDCSGTSKVVQAAYWTSDPVSSVTAFYQSKLGSGLNVMGLGGETIMNYGSGNNTVTMMVDSESGKTKVNVIHTFTPSQ